MELEDLSHHIYESSLYPQPDESNQQ